MATPTPETALLDKIEAALVEFRLTPTAFGRLTVSDTNLVYELRAGTRSISLRTLKKIEDYIEGERRRREAQAKRRPKRAGEKV